MRASLLALLLSVLLMAVAVPVAANGTEDPDVPHLLVFSRTDGFRHGSIGHSHEVIAQLATDSGAFTAEFSEDTTVFTAEKLAETDIILFANTTGEHPFSDAQKAMIKEWVLNGGGFMGIHAAADTNYEWPFYQELVGAAFSSHPHTGNATVKVENPDHPIHADTEGDTITLNEEYYKWRENPRYTQDLRVLLSLDVSSTGFFRSGMLFPQYDEDQPLEWVKTYRGAGRVWYTNLGHFDATYDRPEWQDRFLNAVEWVHSGVHDGGDEQPEPERLPGVPAVFVAPPSAQTEGFAPGPVMTQGGTGSFTNLDAVEHNVQSVATDPNGYPLFRSDFVLLDSTAVEGVQDLVPGEYDYICNIHPNMAGVLTVVG